MGWFTLVSILATVLFVGGHWVKTKELPDSISACVYAFEKKGALLLWTLFIWVAGGCGVIPLVVKLGSMGWLGFLGIIGFGFLGVMPLIRGTRNLWHYLVGIATGVVSQVCVAIVNPWWLVVWSLMGVAVGSAFAGFADDEELPAVMDGKGVLLAECICAVTVWGAGLW